MIYRSEEQQHRFNQPFQLTGVEQSDDRPEHADQHSHDVIAGDLVILGTDGLFDNLNNDQLLDVVKVEVPRFLPRVCGRVNLSCFLIFRSPLQRLPRVKLLKG